MSVCQHLFKRVDLIKSNPGGFCFILYFNIIFQVVPAVTVNKDIPRRRKSFQNVVKKGCCLSCSVILVEVKTRNPRASIYCIIFPTISLRRE